MPNSASLRRDWVHHARHGNPWVFRRPRGELPIAPLVSPLRFDMTVRAAYFEFYGERRELFRTDFDAYAEQARNHDYHVWFTQVMCPAWQPHVLADEGLLAAAWAERLRRSAELYDSFERTGFDPAFPVTLLSGLRTGPTKTGKRLSRALHAGDGNHRIAVLMAAGKDVLEPSQYRVKQFLRLTPIDTTPLLLAALQVDEQRYLAFLRTGYPSIRAESLEGLRDAAMDAELRNVLRVDTPHLKRAPL